MILPCKLQETVNMDVRASLLNNNFHKLEKFDGEQYNNWKRKISLNLQLVNVEYVLTSGEPAIPATGSVDEISATTTAQQQ